MDSKDTNTNISIRLVHCSDVTNGTAGRRCPVVRMPGVYSVDAPQASDSTPAKALVVFLKMKLYPDCLLLGLSQERTEERFTIELT